MCPENRDTTRMRSSGMRTVRCSGHLGRGCLPGGVCLGGCLSRGCLPGGSAQGGNVCLGGGRLGCICPGEGGCGQTDTCKKHDLSATTVDEGKYVLLVLTL